MNKSNEECEEAIRKFAEVIYFFMHIPNHQCLIQITDTDEAFAHMVLQDFDYDLNVSYFRI